MNKTQQTSLYQEHLRLGAKMAPFANWDMPIQYTSVKEEVLAVRNHVGVFDVSHMGEFFIRGKDATKFADYLVTNDISSAPVGKAIYSPLCRDDGTIIDDLIVYKIHEEKILICVNASNIEKDFSWIHSKLNGFECELTNESTSYSLLALQGPKSYEVLKNIITNLPDLHYYSVAEVEHNQHRLIVARTGYTGEDGFEIFGNSDIIFNLWRAFLEQKVVPCGLAARDVLRLEVCYPLYGHELNDSITPYDSGISWTVKLNKNNFLGKNSLLSKPQKFKLIKLMLDKGIPREGYCVYDSQNNQIGVVTSGTLSVVLGKGIALARVKIEMNNSLENEDIFVDIRGKKFPAQIVTKSFITGGHK